MRKHKKTLMRLIPIAIAIIVTIILSEIFYQNMVNKATTDSWHEMETAHSEISKEIDINLSSNLKMLDLVSDAIMMNVDFENKSTIVEYLTSVQTETIFDRIDMVFPNGNILVQNGSVIKDNGEKTYDELVSKGTHISQRVPDFLDPNREVIHCFSPIYDKTNTPIAIIGATIYCSTLAKLFVSEHYGDDAQLFLVDMRDGKIVLDKLHDKLGSIYDMQNYDAPNNSMVKDPIADMLEGNSGTMSYTSKTYKTNSYTYYAPVNEYYTLTMVIQEDIVFSRVNEMRYILTWVGIIETILLVIFAIWIYNIVKKSMEYENRASDAELELLRQKEEELQTQYDLASNRQEFLELMAINLPGGYHRCTTDDGFKVTFISNSFTQVTGYTKEDLINEFDGSYLGIVADEDKEFFMSLEPELEREGYIDCAYRIKRKDNNIRWVKDTTQYVKYENEQYYQCALLDITEQIEEINHARKQAEASSHAKSTFLFNISHDIRTPMNAIKGFSRIIRENANNENLVTEAVDKIDQAGESLMMLMNDVLDISRIERGKEELNLKPLYLYEHNKNIYQMFASDMKTVGINFKTSGDDLDDYVYCDELKLTRILMNMLSNAKKFTKPGGEVILGAKRISKDETTCIYSFYVKDTGIGMSPEFAKKAFEQFERERTSTESGITGSGLGLAIIKMLVELMNGTVQINSEVGKGTEIIATIPFKLAPKEEVQEVAKRDHVTLDMKDKRILLVEDNEFNRDIAKYVLKSMNLIVDEAVNGLECIEKILNTESGYYDLILMDIQMPIKDGYDTTIEIRNLPNKEKANIPIVAMTANAFEEDKKKCYEVGMNGHIGKPFEIIDLIKVLSTIFK